MLLQSHAAAALQLKHPACAAGASTLRNLHAYAYDAACPCICNFEQHKEMRCGRVLQWQFIL